MILCNKIAKGNDTENTQHVTHFLFYLKRLQGKRKGNRQEKTFKPKGRHTKKERGGSVQGGQGESGETHVGKGIIPSPSTSCNSPEDTDNCKLCPQKASSSGPLALLNMNNRQETIKNLQSYPFHAFKI